MRTFILVLFLPIAAFAQLWVAENSRTGAVWTNNYGEAKWVDFAKRDDAWVDYKANPLWVAPQKFPALVDVSCGTWVYLTNWVSATNQLFVLSSNAFPVSVKYKNKTLREYANSGKTNSAANANSAAKIGDLQPIYEQLEALAEKLERAGIK